MSHNQEGDNYNSSIEYLADMSNPFTYGSLCKLVAAGQIYPFHFEVYYNGTLYESFGHEHAPVKKLCISLDLSMGHFDVYMPLNDFSKTQLPQIYNVSTHSHPSPKKNLQKIF